MQQKTKKLNEVQLTIDTHIRVLILLIISVLRILIISSAWNYLWTTMLFWSINKLSEQVGGSSPHNGLLLLFSFRHSRWLTSMMRRRGSCSFPFLVMCNWLVIELQICLSCPTSFLYLSWQSIWLLWSFPSYLKECKSVLPRHSIERLTSLFESNFAPLLFMLFVEIHVFCCWEKNWPPLLQWMAAYTVTSILFTIQGIHHQSQSWYFSAILFFLKNVKRNFYIFFHSSGLGTILQELWQAKLA